MVLFTKIRITRSLETFVKRTTDLHSNPNSHVLYNYTCRFKDGFVWKSSKTALIAPILINGPQLIFITWPSWTWLHWRRKTWLTRYSLWWTLSLVETSYLLLLLATFRCFCVRCVIPGSSIMKIFRLTSKVQLLANSLFAVSG